MKTKSSNVSLFDKNSFFLVPEYQEKLRSEIIKESDVSNDEKKTRINAP